LIKQQICRRLFWSVAGQYEDTFKSKSSSGCCGLTAMIGLQRPASNQRLRGLVTRFRYEKFQFSSLVTAKGKSGLIVALDQQTWSAQGLGKTRE
jgi:hypothetical protein